MKTSKGSKAHTRYYDRLLASTREKSLKLISYDDDDTLKVAYNPTRLHLKSHPHRISRVEEKKLV